MTPGARLQAVNEVCAAIAAATVPPDAVIKDYFRTRRYAGAKDRQAVIDQIYRVLRHRARLDWWIIRAGSAAASPRARLLADLVLGEGCGPPRLAELFSGARHCPAALADDERALAEALAGQVLADPAMPRWVALEYPEWLDGPLARALGKGLEAEMAALNEPAPVDVRVNRAKVSRDEAARRLDADGVPCRPTPLSPVGLRLKGRPRLGGTEAFRRGLVEVQDEGSQLIALLTDAHPEMTVIDLCAGAGGKSLALADAMAGRGTLIACDTSAKRLARMAPRLERAGAGPVLARPLASADDPWLARYDGRADRVLVDAPCSGTGTWRRNPEARWRLTPKALAAMTEDQGAILASAARLVRPGGRLVYATCSLLAEENEDPVADFLAAHRAFAPFDAAALWAGTVGGPCPAAGPSLRLSPAATGTDGFFVTILEHRP